MYCVYEIRSYITHELFSYIFFLNTEILIWSEWCGCLIKDLNNQKMSSIWQISSSRIQGGRRRVEAENAIVVIRERHWQLLHQHSNQSYSEKVIRWLLRSRLYSKVLTASWSASELTKNLLLPPNHIFLDCPLFSLQCRVLLELFNSAFSLPSAISSLFSLLSFSSNICSYWANSFFFSPLSTPAKLSTTRTHKTFYKIAK